MPSLDKTGRHARVLHGKLRAALPALASLMILGVGTPACGGRSELENDGATSLSQGAAAGASALDSGGNGAGGTMTSLLQGGAGGTSRVGTSGSGVGGTIATEGHLSFDTSVPVFCSGSFSGVAYPGELSIWSDDRGVFVLWHDLTSQAKTIYLNAGSGWSEISGANGSSSSGLTGFADGPLVEYGSNAGGTACGIALIESGKATCSAAASDVNQVVTIDRNLAYAISGNRILKYDGVYWSQWGQPIGAAPNSPAYTLWASTAVVLVTADDANTNLSTAYVFPNADPSQPALQTGISKSHVSAAWGFGPNDLWLGNNAEQLLHFDGLNWSTAWSGAGNCSGIKRLWGADGVLYFTTDSAIGMWRDGQVTMLAEYPCNGSILVQSLWGNAANEVFFALTDTSAAANACGVVKILWFNGVVLTSI